MWVRKHIVNIYHPYLKVYSLMNFINREKYFLIYLNILPKSLTFPHDCVNVVVVDSKLEQLNWLQWLLPITKLIISDS